MKHSAIDTFAALGERLMYFGTDTASGEVMRRAEEENSWFTPTQTVSAVGAICEQMLDRKRLQAWADTYTELSTPHTSHTVGIAMAGNIPLVGFADLLYVLVSGNTAAVKTSSKDKVLMRYVIEQLRHIEPSIPICDLTDATPIDALIATGSDSARMHFEAQYGSLPTLLRGSRHSAAVLSGNETAAQIAALGKDIYSYWGLGCRNISLVFAPAGYELRLPPRTHLCSGYENNLRRERALMQMRGEEFAESGNMLFCHARAFSDSICRLNIAPYASLAEVTAWLSQHDTELQCVVSECIQHPSRVTFGRAQYPSLSDYADRVDVMKFLLSL